MAAPASDASDCVVCRAHGAQRRWFRSRKFWCVMLGMGVPPVMWWTIALPIPYVVAMQFFPAAWGFGEWMLDFVKEVTKLLTAWRQVKGGGTEAAP